MDRSMPELVVQAEWDGPLSWNDKASAKINPWDQSMSTAKSLGNTLAEGGPSLAAGENVGAKGAIHFSGNNEGALLEHKMKEYKGGSRYITTKPIDVSAGGVVRSFVRYGHSEGGDKCKTKFDKMVAEYARVLRCQKEVGQKAKCMEKASSMCNGRGTPKYISRCHPLARWDPAHTGKNQPAEGDCSIAEGQWKCAEGKTTFSCDNCNCKPPFSGNFCTLPFRHTGWCRSVGDPHPSTFNGRYTNLYDGGEFVWFAHPDIPIEAHITSYPRGFVAVNGDFSLERCKKRDPNTKAMVPPCEGVTGSGASWSTDANGKTTCGTLKYNCVRRSGRVMSTKNCNSMEMNEAKVVISFSMGGYKNSYLRAKILRDGKSFGVCGPWGGNDYAGTLASGGSRRGQRMYSNQFYNEHRITDGSKSHFRCGGARGSVRRHWYSGFRETATKIASKRSLRASAAAEMQAQIKAQEKSLEKLWAAEDVVNRARRADPKPEGDVMTADEARKRCQKEIMEKAKMQTVDEDTLIGCIKDMVKVGNKPEGKKATLALADSLFKENFVVTLQSIAQDAAEEKQDLAEELPLLLPAKTDLVLQYCVKNCDPTKGKEIRDKKKPNDCIKYRDDSSLLASKDEKHPVRKMNAACDNDGGGWKIMKTFGREEYGKEIEDGFKRFTTRIPDEVVAEAKKHNQGKLRLRYYQHLHPECYCCSPVALDGFKVQTGGWPVRIVADDSFELWADGKQVGEGSWAKRDNSIDVNRFRVSKNTQVVGVKVVGMPKSRGRPDDFKTGMSALLASIGDSLVSSSTWRCKDIANGAKVDPKWSQKGFNEKAKDWPRAAELGDNQDPGTEPWGVIPGIAKSAKWINTHSTTQNSNLVTFCRVDTNDAWHSYDNEHLAASRWSCNNRLNRQSPYVIALDDKNSKYSFPRGRFEDPTEARSPNKKSMEGWATISRKMADVKQGSKTVKAEQEFTSMLIGLKLADIMDKTTEGAMVKVATLRIFTHEEGGSMELCRIGAGSGLDAKWSPDDVTLNRVRQNGVDGCIPFKSVKKDFVKVDVSDWVRQWRTDPSTNFGMIVRATADGEYEVGAPDIGADDADLRPRLSLSCHGDQADPDMVFKSKGMTTLEDFDHSKSGAVPADAVDDPWLLHPEKVQAAEKELQWQDSATEWN